VDRSAVRHRWLTSAFLASEVNVALLNGVCNRHLRGWAFIVESSVLAGIKEPKWRTRYQN
jgi:hypothetical protein